MRVRGVGMKSYSVIERFSLVTRKGDFKSLYLLSIAQIRAWFLKCSLTITYFRITWVFIKIADSRTLPGLLIENFWGLMPGNMHFKQRL